MSGRAQRGQATVEFSLVIIAFLLIVFGTLEVARAVFERHSLARAAEVIAQELAETDPNRYSTAASFYTFSIDPRDSTALGYLTTAISDANIQAKLGLATSIPATPIRAGTYNSSNHDCSGTSTTQDSCESFTNRDGSVTIVGIPDLTAPDTIRVTVFQPYQSFLGAAIKPLFGNGVSESVAATTLSGQHE